LKNITYKVPEKRKTRNETINVIRDTVFYTRRRVGLGPVRVGQWEVEYIMA